MWGWDCYFSEGGLGRGTVMVGLWFLGRRGSAFCGCVQLNKIDLCSQLVRPPTHCLPVDGLVAVIVCLLAGCSCSLMPTVAGLVVAKLHSMFMNSCARQLSFLLPMPWSFKRQPFGWCFMFSFPANRNKKLWILKHMQINRLNTGPTITWPQLIFPKKSAPGVGVLTNKWQHKCLAQKRVARRRRWHWPGGKTQNALIHNFRVEGGLKSF